MKHTAALLIIAVVIAAPASAAAAPRLAEPIPGVRTAQADQGTGPTPRQDVSSDRTALKAYQQYLSTLVSQLPTAQADDELYIETISDDCKSALEPLTEPGDEVDTQAQHTLTVLGEEIGDDLSITFDQAAVPAFTRFSDVLSRLRWTRMSGAALALKHYVDSESAALAMQTSQLCEDALMAAASPDHVPSGTQSFLKGYTKASEAANAGLQDMLKLLQSYEVPDEKKLLARVTTLAGELTSQTQSDLLQSGSTLTSTLEST